MGKKTISGNIALTPSECSTLKDYAVNGILAKAENSRLEEKLQQAKKSATVWKQRYESLKEQALSGSCQARTRKGAGFS